MTAQPECINICICPTTNVLVSDILLVKKNYILWNENVGKDIAGLK